MDENKEYYVLFIYPKWAASGWMSQRCRLTGRRSGVGFRSGPFCVEFNVLPLPA